MLADMPVVSLMLVTSDGCSLDSDLSVPDGPVRAAAVICHPHPLYGGDRHNNVVDALFRALPPVGVAALRFDFRGVGRSTGTHGLGVDEGLDLVAALDELSSRWPALPLIAAGYSFGSMVALGAGDPRVAGWVAVAPPLSAMKLDASAVADDSRPKLVLAAEHDQFTPSAVARAVCADWVATTEVEIPAADHFLAGRTAWVVERVTEWLDRVLTGGASS